MKSNFCTFVTAVLLLANSVSAHYIFNELIYGGQTSKTAVRQPQNNSPFHEYASGVDIRCNTNPFPARDTVTVNAGDTIGFSLTASYTGGIYHEGPVAIYLGKAPQNSAAKWDGSGQTWFKIAEWGPVSDNPMKFASLNMNRFTATIPKSTPSGEYLVRIEQDAFHIARAPEIFVSCAQIRIANGGNGNPPTVSIPGHIAYQDASMMIDIYPPNLHPGYKCPGPAVWHG